MERHFLEKCRTTTLMGRLKKKTTKKQNTKRVFIPNEFRLSRRLLEDVSQFVGLPFLLSLLPSWFFHALANEATGGQFFSGSRETEPRTESEVEAVGGGRGEGRNGKKKKKKAAEIIFTPSRPPPPTPPESITRATLLTLGRPTLFWSINAHPAP